MEPHQYTVQLQWQEKKSGVLKVDNVNTTIQVATPLPFPGGIDTEWSPEHLLIASVSSCFMTTFIAIAENSQLPFKDFSCEAKGILALHEGKYKITEVYLYPRVVIVEEQKKGLVERILEKSKKACLISNSINSEVYVVSSIDCVVQ
jgi:peroxiredoxin-like protein